MKGINLFVFAFTIILLRCTYSWLILAWIPNNFNFIGAFVFICFLLSYQKLHLPSAVGVFAYLLIAFGYCFELNFSIIPVLGHFVLFLPVLTFFMLPYSKLKGVLMGIEQFFFILVFLSFALFCLDKIHLLPLHGSMVHYNQYYFYNYGYIYLNVIRYEGAFSGFSIEPGYFSRLLVCLLLINEFDFKKKRNLLYTVALLCTLSLGGYLLAIIGFLLQRVLKERRITREIMIVLSVVVFVALVVIGAFFYKNGNNILMDEIISRMAYDDEFGIVGNNRENLTAKPIIDEIFYSDKVWFGIGNERWHNLFKITDFDACSWRMYVIRFGAVYTIMFWLCSILFLFRLKLRVVLPFFIIYWLDFIQHGLVVTEMLYIIIIYMEINKKVSYSPNKLFVNPTG